MRMASTGCTKVFGGLTSVALATEQDSVGASGGTLSQLIQGQSLTSSLDDAGTGSGSKLHGSHGHLGDDQEALVVSDSTDQNGNSTLRLALHLVGNGGQGHGRTVSLAHAQALGNDLVEGRFGAASQEAVQLGQQQDVWVFRDRLDTVLVADVVLFNIDTLNEELDECSTKMWCEFE